MSGALPRIDGLVAQAANRTHLAAALVLDAQAFEQLAELIAAKLDERERTRSSWVTADVVAAHLGVNLQWVYDHGHELGGIRLGAETKQGHWRFVSSWSTTPSPARPPSPRAGGRGPLKGGLMPRSALAECPTGRLVPVRCPLGRSGRSPDREESGEQQARVPMTLTVEPRTTVKPIGSRSDSSVCGSSSRRLQVAPRRHKSSS